MFPFSVCSRRLVYGFCRRLEKRKMRCRLVLCAMMSSKGGLKCEKTWHQTQAGGGNCSELQRKRERIIISSSLPLTKHRAGAETGYIDGVFKPKRGHQDLFQTSLIVSHQQIPDWSDAVIFAYFPLPITFPSCLLNGKFRFCH
jgi:hypothetical protein